MSSVAWDSIRTVILAMAPGNRWCGAPLALSFFLRFRVRSVDRNRRRIVVQFVETDVEFSNHLPHHGQDEIGTSAFERAMQTASKAVVVQQRHFVVEIGPAGPARSAPPIWENP